MIQIYKIVQIQSDITEFIRNMSLIISLSKTMGNSSAKVGLNNLSSHQAPLDQYQIASSGPNYYIWYSEMLKQQLIQYPFTSPNQAILDDHLESYLWRHRHYLLVSTIFINSKAEEEKYSIFYERVFTNLSRLKDLCFEDALQFYYVGLRGFQLLYQRFGHFEVQEEMFHITTQNKAKVWCDRNISRIFPATQGMGNEQSMVRKVISIVDSNSDQAKMKIPIGHLLSRQPSLSFRSALEKLRNICKLNKLHIPNKLTCLQTLCEGKIESIVDEYGVKQQNCQNKQAISNQSITINSNNTSNTKISKTFSHIPANSSSFYTNINFNQPARQNCQSQCRRQYYSLPKIQSQPNLSVLPSPVFSKNFPHNSAKVIVNPIPSQVCSNIVFTHANQSNPIYIEPKRPKSLQPTPQSHRYYQKLPTSNMQNEKNSLNQPATKRSVLVDNLKKSTTIFQNNPINNKNNAQNFLKRSQHFIQAKKQQMATKVPIKETHQIKKSSKVNFKYVNPVINSYKQKAIHQQTLIRQQITISSNVKLQGAEINSRNARKPVQQKQIAKTSKIQNIPKVTLSSTLDELQKRCQVLHQKLNKTNMKGSQTILPFRQIQALDKNQLKIFVHKPKINTLENNEYSQLQSRQQINISRELKEEKIVANNISQRKEVQTISTIQSGNNLQQKVSQKNNQMKKDKQVDQQVVLERFPKQNQKRSPTKKYTPQIDDDIWKDMLKMKTKSNHY